MSPTLQNVLVLRSHDTIDSTLNRGDAYIEGDDKELVLDAEETHGLKPGKWITLPWFEAMHFFVHLR